jgi:hypothetical protein
LLVPGSTSPLGCPLRLPVVAKAGDRITLREASLISALELAYDLGKTGEVCRHPIVVERNEGREAIAVTCGAFHAERTDSDSFRILEFVVSTGGRPFGTEEMQVAVDGQVLPSRRRTLRARLLEVCKELGGAVRSRKVAGKRHKEWFLVAEVVDGEPGSANPRDERSRAS